MKTNKSILNIILAVTISGLVISGCKKKDEEAPAPTPVVSVVPNGSQSQQTQKVNDQTSFDDETNKAMDDAINALEYCSKTRDIQALCNTTVDTTFAAQGKITLTYTGNDCLSLTSRSGSIIIQLPYNGTTLTTWTTAGSKAQLTFVNYKVTRLSNNKSLTFNGYHAIKNVNGGGVIQLLAGATILHQIRADMQITFDDGTSRTWLVAKTRTFTNVLGLITNTIAGDTTGTWVGATNGLGILLSLSLGAGTNRSGTAGAWNANNNYSATGATSVVGTNGATFFLTGVQLEVGSTATSFDYRPYGTELQLCQRYYETSFDIGTAPANAVNDNFKGIASFGTSDSQSFSFKVYKRAAPTMTWYSSNVVGSPTAGQWQFLNAGSAWANGVATQTNRATMTQCSVYVNSSGQFSSGQASSITGNWAASAEL